MSNVTRHILKDFINDIYFVILPQLNSYIYYKTLIFNGEENKPIRKKL